VCSSDLEQKSKAVVRSLQQMQQIAASQRR
jgi:hypothetical protein